MRKSLRIQCPFCRGSMDVDCESGKILDKWEKKPDNLQGKDQMREALKKIHEGRQHREELFNKAKSELNGKKDKMDELFREQLKKVKSEGDDGKPPHGPFSLD